MVLNDGEVLESLNIGDFKIIQSEKLYKFTSDAVLLSRFARGGAESVLDLCAGGGIVSLHYYALHDGCVKRCVCSEIQPALAELNVKSIAVNGLKDRFEVINAPLQELNLNEKFDLVLCNPPYVKRGAGITPKDEVSAICKTEAAVTLDEIFACAERHLKRGGQLCMCHKINRLEEIFALFKKYSLSPARLQFVSGKGDKAYLVLFEAIKGKKCEMSVYNTVINDFVDFSGERKGNKNQERSGIKP